jgi:hypothetical protein
VLEYGLQRCHVSVDCTDVAASSTDAVAEGNCRSAVDRAKPDAKELRERFANVLDAGQGVRLATGMAPRVHVSFEHFPERVAIGGLWRGRLGEALGQGGGQVTLRVGCASLQEREPELPPCGGARRQGHAKAQCCSGNVGTNRLGNVRVIRGSEAGAQATIVGKFRRQILGAECAAFERAHLATEDGEVLIAERLRLAQAIGIERIGYGLLALERGTVPLGHGNLEPENVVALPKMMHVTGHCAGSF